MTTNSRATLSMGVLFPRTKHFYTYVPRGSFCHNPCTGFRVFSGYPLGTLNLCNKSFWQSSACWDIFLWTVINWLSIIPTATHLQYCGYKLSLNCTIPLCLHFTQEAVVHWPDIIASSMSIMFFWLWLLHATSCQELYSQLCFSTATQATSSTPNCVA